MPIVTSKVYGAFNGGVKISIVLCMRIQICAGTYFMTECINNLISLHMIHVLCCMYIIIIMHALLQLHVAIIASTSTVTRVLHFSDFFSLILGVF